MAHSDTKICVYFDGACPKCIKDRDAYLRLAGRDAKNVSWVDITNKEKELMELGIEPNDALHELHIKVDSAHQSTVIVKELDAYILLMKNTRLLKPLAWLMSMAVVKSLLSKLYANMVHKRLKQSGRL